MWGRRICDVAKVGRGEMEGRERENGTVGGKDGETQSQIGMEVWNDGWKQKRKGRVREDR